MAASELDPAVLALVRAGMGKVKVPHSHDKVYKDECLYSFDTPFTPTGLYVNLATWGGAGRDMLGFDSQRTGSTLYAHLRYTKVPKEEEAEEEGKMAAPEATVLGLGVEGGFKLDSQKYDVVKEFALAVLAAPGDAASLVEVPFPNQALPEFVSTAIQAIIDHQGAASQTDEAAWLAEEEPRPVSKYADALPQLDNGVKISADPTTWKCAESGQTENLWLNLSTGYIGSGRPQLVNDKVIGTGAALKHFDETGKQYPLVVKLGTITPQGADVYSYAPDEDCMVKDPKLAEHLAHWGIDAMKLEKTDKSLAELELESQKWAFSRITEAGAALTPLRGPGFVGLKNLGNSCYMNSVLQLLFTLPEMRRQYLDRYDAIVKERAVADPATDVLTQTAKLALGLCSARYSPPATEAEIAAAAASKDSDFTQSIEPRMFKTLVGKGHPEFSSGRQQDAQEYLDHVLNVLLKAERVGLGGAFYTEGLFKYELEERLHCQASGKVRYASKVDTQLHLSIPLEAATNATEVAQYQERKQKRQKLTPTPDNGNGGGNGAPQPVETASAVAPAAAADAPKKEGAEEEPEVVPVVPFQACIAAFASPNIIADYQSPALPADAPRTTASTTMRFKTFPPYLVVHLQRYYVDTATWQGKKMEVSVPMPPELDLTAFRGMGQRQGEELLPADAPVAATGAAASSSGPPAIQPNEDMAAQMADFGFSANAIKRALVAVQNASVDGALSWLFEHSGDADINDPLPDPSAATAGAASGGGPSAEEAANLAAMLGFTEEQARAALTATGNNMERAADWLFSRAGDLNAAVAEVLGGGGAGGGAGAGGPAKDVECADGEGKYELVGFASHVGKNLGSGHYVAHIRKGGRWVIFDDQKVAVSEQPPLDLGYLYVYRRLDGMEMD